MDLTITKEKVLEAAGKCSTAKATLQVLFPEVFENDDLAIKPGVLNNSIDKDLSAFCKRAFGDEYTIQVLYGAALSDNLCGRGLYVHFYRANVELIECSSGVGIVFKKSKMI